MKQKILFDANVIICLHKFSMWKKVIYACNATVTPIIRSEVRFYKDEKGIKKSIELSQNIKAQKLGEIPVSMEHFSSLGTVLKDSFLQSIDDGEREAIAFLYNTRQSNQYLFCTADMLAIKCLGVLGLRFHGISLQELCEKLAIKTNPLGNSIHAHSKDLFERMLEEGFLEAHLHKN